MEARQYTNLHTFRICRPKSTARRSKSTASSRIGRCSISARRPALLSRRLHLRSRTVVYHCPGGTAAALRRNARERRGDEADTAFSTNRGSALKPTCCPNTPARKIPRSIHEGARDMARQIASSWEGATSRRLRKKVEMLFAHLKRILRLDRLRLRGRPAPRRVPARSHRPEPQEMAKLVPPPNLKPA